VVTQWWTRNSALLRKKAWKVRQSTVQTTPQGLIDHFRPAGTEGVPRRTGGGREGQEESQLVGAILARSAQSSVDYRYIRGVMHLCRLELTSGLVRSTYFAVTTGQIECDCRATM
jgi:hypothetical protein